MKPKIRISLERHLRKETTRVETYFTIGSRRDKDESLWKEESFD